MAIISRVGSRPGHRRPSPQSARSRTPWRTAPSSFSYSASRRAQRSSACVGGITNGSRLCGARPRAGRPTTSRSSSTPTRRCRRRSTTARPTTGGPSWRSPTSLAASGPNSRVRHCLTLTGESPEEPMGVTLLADCRPAFGDNAVMRSVDLVSKLVADPERPWAEYNRGKAITQRQLARLLGTFGIISVNVNPPGLAQGKGYRRADSKEAWASYCPGQTPARGDSDISIRPSVQRPVESAQVDGFASVHEVDTDGSKNGKSSYSHAGLDGWTDKKLESGAPSDSAATETLSSDPGGDPGDIPECLRRHLCDHCGGAVGAMRNYEWPGRSDGVWLHAQCEAPWFDSEGCQ